MTSRKILFLIIGVAFLIRILGINYGLPLWLVADEPPFIFGALKMMELKTLIPALHSNDFMKALYYPPYLSYFYLPFFAIFLGIKYLFIGGSFDIFKNIIIADPSGLFLITRFLMVILGTATVWLVYKTAQNIFKSEAVALLSSGFLAFSFIHTNFSHWGRHWIPVTFIFSLVIYILSREDFSSKKKYLLACLIAGIGAGVNFQAAVSAIFILLWFIAYDRLLSIRIFKERWVYGAMGLFTGLVLLAYLLYPAGLVISERNFIGTTRNLSGFFGSYLFHASNLFYNDPAVLLFFILGLIFSFFYNRKYFWIASLFVFFYIAIFYVLLFQVDRYILMLFPVLALTAGYCLFELWQRARPNFRFLVVGLGIICFVFSSAMIIKFDQLLLKNDTRIQAINLVKSTIPKGTKIAITAPFLRMPTMPSAIKELERIDSGALRQVDFAEMALANKAEYHVLNLSNLKSGIDIKKYLTANHYQYLIARDEKTDEALDVVNWFGGGWQNSYDTLPWFSGGWKNIFKMENNGPQINIIEL